VPDSRGRLGDFRPSIQKKIEQKINSKFENVKSADFQLFETLKIIKWKCEIDRSYHFFLIWPKKLQVSKVFSTTFESHAVPHC
jgi:hypothetical protein